ncbi:MULTISPECIES: alpha/beta hydrolase [Rhodanobacter]|uniref:alpha/beta hydrolase n=1 Tax=Rhodanobacter TaxID=75309 RepID=UPI00041951C1|nr:MULTISPECIES: alpha/beta fold hydrolase [Rhodanobacter]KZC18735.1 phospholipase [Rhodanobacter denitrificans]UJJ57491.1 alpha/beta fold hydrolase [Rhodanobacter denitrificans]UJM93033.1 alpha/beta fold hydrolase [Rhodanobacter denitrificans]UJM96563.1 alpha/beta fold hydrolase [Rhodanobacter denitrificans]UJN20607.1 alpha/beta fold hydrolase [Rhodanobacter denitrificans]
MKTLSPLSVDPAFALAFRTLQPLPARPTSLLVLLHGVGGNEGNLAALGAEAGGDTLVVLPRGPIALGPQAFGWFRVAFSSSGPQIVASEADASRRTLIDFIGQLQQAHGIDAAHTVVAGFSQGGILSASVALTAPERVAAFAVLAGRILPELEAQLADAPRLSTLRGYIAHGTHDDKLPVGWAQRASDWLTRLGVAHETKRYPAGHELGAAMRADFLAWLARDDQRWNRPAAGQ